MPRQWDRDAWMVFFWDPSTPVQSQPDAFLESIVGDLEAWRASRPRRKGQPFFVGPGGSVDVRLNRYFNTARRRRLSTGINRKAAYALRVWLEFLRKRGAKWDGATEQDIDDFAEAKRYDLDSPLMVQGNSWHGELGQLKAFYRWASSTFNVHDPISTTTKSIGGVVVERIDVDTHANRQHDVKWLSPGAQARWRDVGILGVAGDGTEAKVWRSRCGERDLAYVEGLYRTGLRMQEWASFLLLELPSDEKQRWFYTLALTDACAKGGYGHKFWIDHIAVNHVRTYKEGERQIAIASARARGMYESVRNKVLLLGYVRSASGSARLRLRFADGKIVQRSLNDVSPDLRMRLFRETEDGLEPAMLWLNENGMPRPKRAWFKTVDLINARVRRAGISHLSCTQHMLRHSFALRWYTVGKLINEGRLMNVSPDEAEDFRAEFGSTWHLVQTMLGHRTTETTKNVYLAPFIALDVELLLEHAADDASIRRLLDAALREHPSVIVAGAASA